MGTTLTSGFQNTDGMAHMFVVAIEGYDVLLHNIGSTYQVTQAWGGTGWTSTMPGLQVQFESEQTLEPWKSTIHVGGLSFGIMDYDDRDLFGEKVFGTHAGVSTYLDEDLDCTETTISVLSTAAFASSGHIHIGTECISYSGKTATTFTGCVRGKYAPFKAEGDAGQRFGRAHDLPTVGDGVVTRPKVTSVPRTWKGRWVGVWLHRRTGATFDTKAQAQCIWAGKIVGKRDEANGMTWIECEDAKSAIRGCTLLNDQWSAKISEGIVLQAGQAFVAHDNKAGAPEVTTALVVVASGAAGANEINAGLTSLEELALALNQWFASEKTAARLNFSWTWTPRAQHESGEIRSLFKFSNGSTTDTNSVELSMPGAVAKFMGLGGWGNFGTGGSMLNFDDQTALEYFSPEKPYRTVVEPSYRFEVEDARGTLWNNKLYLPGEFGVDPADPGEFMVLQVDDGAMWVVEAISATVFQRVAITTLDSTIGGGFITPFAGVRVDEGGDSRVKQVAVLRRSFRQILNRIIASTGTAAYNHVATYDVLPAQLGAAIPWEILGDEWETSLANLDQSTAQLLIVLDKPTRLLDVIGCELAARFAQIVWKNGGLRFAAWGTPTAAMAEHAFTESNKAAPANTQDNQRTVTNETDKHLVNVVKIKYGRRSGGDYAYTITISDKGSISDHGEREPIEFEMRNSYAFLQRTTDAVVDLSDGIANMMAIFARPLHMLKRTVDLSLYENVAPGDYCTVTDNHARDPSTGARGLSAKAGLIVGHRYTLGGYEIDTGGVGAMGGEVDVLLMPFNNISAYCPAADIASYVAGTKVATCTAHAYSESSEAADATRFPIGSVIKWLEVDPDDPTMPASGLDTVAAQSGNDITLTTGITGYSASLRYRIISDQYANATTAQKVNVYQADDADALIAAGVNPYEYGMDISGAATYTACTGLEQVALYSDEQYGKGIPLDVGGERDQSRLCNALQNWRTQPVIHSMSRSVKSNPNTCVRTILEILPVFVGPGNLSGGDRVLQVRPWYRSGTGGSVTITATLCRQPPTGTSLIITDADQPEYSLIGPSVSTSWTTSSATWSAGAAADLSLRVADDDGIAFLVIEGTEDAETRGMCQMHVGAYEP